MEICRACTNPSVNVVDIFAERSLPELKFSLAYMISEIVDVPLSREDKLPLKLCLFCSLSVQSAFKFKRMFEKSYDLLIQNVIDNESELSTNIPITDAHQETNIPELPNKQHENSELCEIKSELICLEDLIPYLGKEMSEKENVPTQQSPISYTNDFEPVSDVEMGEDDILLKEQTTIIDNSQSKEKSNIQNKTKNTLKAKLIRNHRTPKNMERRLCKICNKLFSQVHSLKLHMRIHTGECPYKCDQCPRAFNRKDRLNIHMRHHFLGRDLLRYKCTLCPESFKCDVNLQKHIRMHSGVTPFKCNQ